MATTEELREYYADLLILQYNGKEKAAATIQALAGLAISDQLPALMNDAFDLSSAVGDQLDIIGKYIGAERNVGNIELSDSDFRVLLQLKIISNYSGSSTFEIQTLIYQYFPDEIFFFDYKTMRVSYFISSSVWSNALAQAVILQDLLPYPMAVQRSAIIYAIILDAFFGFRTYISEGYNNSPFNTYADYNEEWPWLTYAYAEAPEEDFALTEGGDVLITEGGEGIEI